MMKKEGIANLGVKLDLDYCDIIGNKDTHFNLIEQFYAFEVRETLDMCNSMKFIRWIFTLQ